MSAAGNKKPLLVTGCPRSGTTALVGLLNHHPDIAVGNERYSRLVGTDRFTPDLFSAPRYSQYDDRDCAKAAFEHPLTVWACNKSRSVKFLGDKIPDCKAIFNQLDRFEKVHVVVILRAPYSVARSYQVRADIAADKGEKTAMWPVSWNYQEAVRKFNETVSVVSALQARLGRGELGDRVSLLTVNYEDIFRPGGDLTQIFEFLGVDPAAYPTDTVKHVKAWRGQERIVAGEIEQYVSLNADFVGFRNLISSQMAGSEKEFT